MVWLVGYILLSIQRGTKCFK